MYKIATFLILLTTLNVNLFSQQLEGIYKLYSSKLDEIYPLYLNFKKNKFISFNLGSSIGMLDSNDELKWVGAGNYSTSKNKFIFEFKTDSNFIQPFSRDSILITYNSSKNLKGIKIDITFNNFVSNYNNATLIVETATKEYSSSLTIGVSKNITLKEGEILKAIKISAIDMPTKYLPFDLSFNSLSYIFFAYDSQSQIKTIKNQKIEFNIKSIISDTLYKLESKSFLKKIDRKELEFLKHLSAGKEVRLTPLLNFSSNE